MALSDLIKNRLLFWENLKWNMLNCAIYLYSWIFYKITKFIGICCKFIIKYIPNTIVPEIPFNIFISKLTNNGILSKSIKIDNIQCNMNDITKKIKILFWIYNDNELRNEGKLILSKYIKYIENCSLIFIDYQIQTKFDSLKNMKDNVNILPKIKLVKKIIEVNKQNKYKYIKSNGNKIDIPFGEIIL